MMSQLVKKVPMENESSISLGGTVRVYKKQLEGLTLGNLEGMGEKYLAWSEYTPVYKKENPKQANGDFFTH